MKKRFFIIFVMSFLTDGDFLTKDTLDTGRTNIKSKNGETKGWLKKDTLDPDRINIYDKNGNQKGYLKKDTLNPDNWRFKIKAKDRSRLAKCCGGQNKGKLVPKRFDNKD